MGTFRKDIYCRFFAFFLTLTFTFHSYPVFAQPAISTSSALLVSQNTVFTPAIIKGVKTFNGDPLRMDFVIDRGGSGLNEADFRAQADLMAKYFLAALTVPDKDIWVNLAPAQRGRMISPNLSPTQMGSDLLAQDYLLKNLSASLVRPDTAAGKMFWDDAGDKAAGSASKVWIVPDKITVYEYNGGAYVDKVHLKIEAQDPAFKANILPLIEKEVNEGKDFAKLRQMVNAMALATWYKQRMKENWLASVYADKSRTRGVNNLDKRANERIYTKYLESFQKGVFNYLQKSYDPIARRVTKRTYFSGGFRRTSGKPGDFTVTQGDPTGRIGAAGDVALVKVRLESQGPSAAQGPVSIGRVADGRVITAEQVRAQVEEVKSGMGSGVLMPISSLPTPEGSLECGMGDIGPAARQFAKDLAAAGQKYWMFLPPHPADKYNSSYASHSNFALDLNINSLEDLIRDGWLTRKECVEALKQFGEVGYDRVRMDMLHYKEALLARAHTRLNGDGAVKKNFTAFKEQEGSDWLDDYAIFKVAQRKYGENWRKWKNKGLKMHDPNALKKFAAQHSEEIEQAKFIQFLTQDYFLGFQRELAKNKIIPIADMPAYSGVESCDVWANRDLFWLDENFEPLYESGSAPDFFNEEGQGWGHPMYKWDNPRILDFFSARYRRMFRLYPKGFKRDDHTIGKYDPWVKRRGESPLQGGRYSEVVGEGKYLGIALFERLERDMPGITRFIIAEDLGTVTDKVRQGMSKHNLPGMVFLPGMVEDTADKLVGSVHSPYNRGRHAVVVAANHDVPSSRGRFQGLKEGQQGAQNEYLRRSGYAPATVESFAQAVTTLAMQARQEMVISWIGDIVTSDSGNMGLVDAQMNRPGTMGPENWSWRLRRGRLDAGAIGRLSKMTEAGNRTADRVMQRLDLVTPYSDSARLALGVLAHYAKDSSLVERFMDILQRGLVRYAPLHSGLLSTVWRDDTGDYILLADKSEGKYLSSEEQAVSLLRAFNQYFPEEKIPFIDSQKDTSLLILAGKQAKHCDRTLEELLAGIPGGELEQMIIFMGTLKNFQSPTKDIKEQLRGMDELEPLGQFQRGLFAEKLDVRWLEVWKKYEEAGWKRRDFIYSFICGKLEESREFNQLRWRVLDAWSKSEPFMPGKKSGVGGFRYLEDGGKFKIVKGVTSSLSADERAEGVVAGAIYGFAPRILSIKTAKDLAQAINF